MKLVRQRNYGPGGMSSQETETLLESQPEDKSLGTTKYLVTKVKVLSQSPGGVMALPRKLLRLCKTKLGTLFILIIVAFFILFVFNYMSGGSSLVGSGQGEGEEDQTHHRRFGHKGHHRRKGHRKGHRHHNDDDDDSEDENPLVCRGPKLTLENDANKDAFSNLPPLDCPGQPLFVQRNGKLHVQQNALGGKKLGKCVVRPILFHSDDDLMQYDEYRYGKPKVVDTEPFEIAITDDFLRITCYERGKTTDIPEDLEYDPEADFDQFVAAILPSEEFKERQKEITPKKNSLQVNVLILAVDSMSHLMYQRKMPKTYSFLTDTLKAAVLDQYNIVGDATVNNLLPLLTGKNLSTLPEARKSMPDSTYVDGFPWIWNKFETSGYVTLFAEERPDIGSFNMRLNGFEQKPVDHYMRPFWLAANGYLKGAQEEGHCLRHKPKHQYQMQYIHQLFQAYPQIPKFAFGFFVEMSHADINEVGQMDSDMYQFLESLKSEGHLDNTVVIMMGDHGPRVDYMESKIKEKKSVKHGFEYLRNTVQGKLEERLPLMAISLPDSLNKEHKNLQASLMANRGSLVTPYDIHETLRTLLDGTLADHEPYYTDRKLTLFHEIPKNRTCGSANIDLHWCTCTRMEEVDVTESQVVTSAKEIVRSINTLTGSFRSKCAELSLKNVLDAKLLAPNEMLLKFTGSIDPDQIEANFSKNIEMDVLNHQIAIETEPNGAKYEATVQYSVKDGSYIVSEVSRTNKYGRQPHCIQKARPDLAKFCYCPT